MLDSQTANACICLKRLTAIRAQTPRNKSVFFSLLQSTVFIQPNRRLGTADNITPFENYESQIHENRT